MGCCSICGKMCGVLVALCAIFVSYYIRTNSHRPALYSLPIFTGTQSKYVSKDRLMDIQGQLALVTGANAGLGFSTTKILASRGAKVVMACRNPKKASKAKQDILELYPEASLEIMIVDFAEMDSVKRFTAAFLEQYDALDMLILNAGLGWSPKIITKDGFNFVFQVNHLSQAFLLDAFTKLLQKRDDRPPARVALVSSGAHRQVTRELDEYLTWDRIRRGSIIDSNDPSDTGAYQISKLAQVLLAKSMTQRNVPYLINSLHPGLVNTEIFDIVYDFFSMKIGPAIGPVVAKIALMFLKNGAVPLGLAWDSDTAALTQVHMVAGKDIVEERISGEYYVPLVYRTVKGDEGANARIYQQEWLDRNMEITNRFIEQFQ